MIGAIRDPNAALTAHLVLQVIVALAAPRVPRQIAVLMAHLVRQAIVVRSDHRDRKQIAFRVVLLDLLRIAVLVVLRVRQRIAVRNRMLVVHAGHNRNRVIVWHHNLRHIGKVRTRQRETASRRVRHNMWNAVASRNAVAGIVSILQPRLPARIGIDVAPIIANGFFRRHRHATMHGVGIVRDRVMIVPIDGRVTANGSARHHQHTALRVGMERHHARATDAEIGSCPRRAPMIVGPVPEIDCPRLRPVTMTGGDSTNAVAATDLLRPRRPRHDRELRKAGIVLGQTTIGTSHRPAMLGDKRIGKY